MKKEFHVKHKDNINGSENDRSSQGLRINVSGNLVILSRCCDYSGVDCFSELAGRSDIEGFSESSRKRMRRYLRETKAEYRTLITLTYPKDKGTNGKMCKEELRRFIQELRRECMRIGSYEFEKWSTFWFLEFQKNGRAHFHILCTEFYKKEWIAKTWANIVKSENENIHRMVGTRIESIRSGRNGIASYVAKYASKFDQKLVPDGFGWVGRFWGIQGYRECVVAATWVSPNSAGHPYVEKSVENIKSTIKSLEKEGKCRNISKKIKDLPHGTEVYRLERFEMGQIFMDKIRFLELWMSINEKREPKIHNDIEKYYDKLVKDPLYETFDC